MSLSGERDVDPIKEMRRIEQKILKLGNWGFRESECISSKKLIYDSECCRISLIWDGWDYMGGNNMQMQYGRLHAPSDKYLMNWHGEECHCWHRVEYVLHFLDGRTPAETASLKYSHAITDPFYTKEITGQFDRQQPEWLATMELTVLQQYGQRLLDVFDLRKPDLWQRYRQFLKDVYDIAGRNEYIVPPMDHIC